MRAVKQVPPQTHFSSGREYRSLWLGRIGLSNTVSALRATESNVYQGQRELRVLRATHIVLEWPEVVGFRRTSGEKEECVRGNLWMKARAPSYITSREPHR